MGSRPADGLFDRLTTFEALWEAARLARRGKRRSRATAAFEHRLEYVLLEVQASLRDGSFRFGPYREFDVREPAPRRIRAAPYRDRVVHHALVAQLEPVLERRMLPCSFACRVGYGTHRALDTLQQYLRGGSWVLKVDVSKYFYSIDHAILRASLAERVACRRTRALIDQVLATYSAHDEYYFPQRGDDLWAPSRPRGVPIGNLTSQLFANWYLNPVDTFVKRTLGWRRYVRYMDDLVFVGPRCATRCAGSSPRSASRRIRARHRSSRCGMACAFSAFAHIRTTGGCCAPTSRASIDACAATVAPWPLAP
jgi:hypothetical protein